MLDRPQIHAGLSLLFAAGARPTADMVEQLLASPEMAGAAARVSYRPPAGEGWAELLASGLTFDLAHLAPAAAAPLPAMGQRFGIDPALATDDLEAVTLVPGHHIAGSGAIMPVVRTMAGLVANLALPLDARAVCWHPAATWMEPGYFARIVMNWLSGGAFPALGLTAIREIGEGAVASRGLDYFAGQEIELAGRDGEAPADTVKLAVRIIDHVVRGGAILSPQDLKGPSGERLRAEPLDEGRRLLVRRGA